MRIAFQALGRNVMRALLTMLGVIIGVAAVIAVMEISRGASTAIQVTVTNMGANTLTVTPGAPKGGSVRYGTRTDTLTHEDAEAIARECPSVADTAPIVSAWGQVVYGNRNWNTGMTGSTVEFLKMRNWSNLEYGRIFNDRELLSGEKVCLIGQTLVRELFGSRYPIGEEIRVKNVPFTVIGVLSEKGGNFLGTDQDDILFAPWTTVKYRLSGAQPLRRSHGRQGLRTLPAGPIPGRVVAGQPEVGALREHRADHGPGPLARRHPAGQGRDRPPAPPPPPRGRGRGRFPHLRQRRGLQHLQAAGRHGCRAWALPWPSFPWRWPGWAS